jgi:hypothetical protein
MTLLDAQVFDEARSRRRKVQITGAILIVLLLAGLVWWFRYWPQERVVGHFFSALQKQDYEGAYGIWMHDPHWREHQADYARYPFNEFYTDWGPGGEWGKINSYKVFWAGNCPTAGNGIVVDVVVNQRAQHAQVYVDKNDKTLGYVPCSIEIR